MNGEPAKKINLGTYDIRVTSSQFEELTPFLTCPLGSVQRYEMDESAKEQAYVLGHNALAHDVREEVSPSSKYIRALYDREASTRNEGD